MPLKPCKLNQNYIKLSLISVLATAIYVYSYSSTTLLGSRTVNRLDNHSSDLTELFRSVTEYENSEKCPDHVILLFDKGRFGNQFLEYVATRVVSVFQKRNFYIVPELSEILNKYFVNYRAKVLDEREFAQNCKVTRNLWTTESLEHFHGTLEDEPETNTSKYVKIIGYPLNITVPTWNLMFQYRNLLLKEFEWKDELKRKTVNRIKLLTTNREFSKLIGVHVRRTDFLQHLKILYGPSKLAGKKYFENAKEIYKKKYGNPLFLVISEDLRWCRQNLAAEDVIFAGEGNEEDPGSDLALLSSFQHLILSYGTFGISAAYLSGAEVIIADNFTTRPNDLNERLKQVNLPNWRWLSV